MNKQISAYSHGLAAISDFRISNKNNTRLLARHNKNYNIYLGYDRIIVCIKIKGGGGGELYNEEKGLIMSG